jgi:hypothetical protein
MYKKKKDKPIEHIIDEITGGGKPSYSRLIKIILYLVRLYLDEREGVVKPEEMIEGADARVEDILELVKKWGK